MGKTIIEMMEQTPEGESRLFPAPNGRRTESRFFLPSASLDAVHAIVATSKNMKLRPRTKLRWAEEVSLWADEAPNLKVKDRKENLKDFARSTGDAYCVSPRLAKFVEEFDPGSLSIRELDVTTKNGTVSRCLIMPKRSLSVVDTDFSDVEIVPFVDGKKGHAANFPGSVVFDAEGLDNLHVFSEIDTRKTFWSIELFRALNKAGFNGFVARRFDDSKGADNLVDISS